jgi:hypothetical protein
MAMEQIEDKMDEVKYTGDKAVSRREEFSVWCTLVDGRMVPVCRWVNAERAAEEFYRCCNNVSAHSGLTIGVKIVDGGDCTNIAWENGRGYTYDGKTFGATPATFLEGLQ